MERVRKNEQNKLSKRFRKYFKKSRYLLMKPMDKLSFEEMNKLALMFEIAPRLADAYRLKNEFLNVIRSDSAKAGNHFGTACFLCVVKRCLFDAYLPPPSLSQIELKYNAVFLHVLVSGIGFY